MIVQLCNRSIVCLKPRKNMDETRAYRMKFCGAKRNKCMLTFRGAILLHRYIDTLLYLDFHRYTFYTDTPLHLYTAPP